MVMHVHLTLFSLSLPYFLFRAPKVMEDMPGQWSTSRNQPTATSATSCWWVSGSKACAAFVSTCPSKPFPPAFHVIEPWKSTFCFLVWRPTHIVPSAENKSRKLPCSFCSQPKLNKLEMCCCWIYVMGYWLRQKKKKRRWMRLSPNF